MDGSTDLALPTSALFIDLPNIVNTGGSPRRRLEWSRLIMALQCEVTGTTPQRATLYATTSGEEEAIRNWEARMLATFGIAGFKLKTLRDKDVDSLIINDIWASIAQYQQDEFREKEILELPIQMKHVLVSGDAGYLRAYRSILDVYGDSIELVLEVYSWKSALSEDMRKFASRIHYLDDIPGLQARH